MCYIIDLVLWGYSRKYHARIWPYLVVIWERTLSRYERGGSLNMSLPSTTEEVVSWPLSHTADVRVFTILVVAISRNLHQHYLKLENNCCVSLEDRLHPAAVLWLSKRCISTITRQYVKSYGSIRIQRSMQCSTGDDPGTDARKGLQVQQVVDGRLMTTSVT